MTCPDGNGPCEVDEDGTCDGCIPEVALTADRLAVERNIDHWLDEVEP